MRSYESQPRGTHRVGYEDKCKSIWNNDCARCAVSYAGIGTKEKREQLFKIANDNYGVDDYNFNKWLRDNIKSDGEPPRLYYIHPKYIRKIKKINNHENHIITIINCTEKISDKLLANNEQVIAFFDTSDKPGHFFNIGKDHRGKIWYIDPQYDINPGDYNIEQAFYWFREQLHMNIVYVKFVLEPWQAEAFVDKDGKPMLIDSREYYPSTGGKKQKKHKYTKKLKKKKNKSKKR
tara:strand:- start:90 stop:794 length:705 start_codon:yes stop_codon:yes gene_type:complete